MLFKFKGIMAFPVEQRDTGQESQVAFGHSQSHSTFYLHPPEAADTVEVSITASTAQGGVLIADAAPREFLFLSLWPGGHSLGLQGAENNAGNKVPDGVWVGGLLLEPWASQEGGCGGCPAVCVWGFSHLRLCPARFGPGLARWLCRDVKATCLIQGSFFSELWTGQRGTAPCSWPRSSPKGSVTLVSQPIFLYLLPMAADPALKGQGQVWVIGTVGPQLE